ncbi:hypothetical protein JCM11641_000642 [Rhodosporidiobolus odoratus]
MTHHERMVHRLKRQRAAATTLVDTPVPVTEVESTTARGRAAAATTTTTAAARGRATATTATTEADATSRVNWRTVGDSSTAAGDTSSSAAATSSVESTTAAARSTNARAVSSASHNTAVASHASSAADSSASSAADGSSSSSGGSNGGAIAGAIIAVVAVLAIIVGFFLWRKKRAARAARVSGTNLFSDSNKNDGYGAGGTTYNKRHETGDSELFAGSSASPNGPSSWNSEQEKNSFGAGAVSPPHQQNFATMPAPANDPWAVEQQRAVSPPQQQQMSQPQGWTAAGLTQQAYPPANGPLPASTANLLSPVPLQAGQPAYFNDAEHQSIEQRELEQELENRRQSMAAKTAGVAGIGAGAGSPAAGASPFGESEGQGEIRIVKGTFDPTLEDELVLFPGDRIQVLMKYDDGWALGLNLNSGPAPAKGVFPFDCLGDIAPAPSTPDVRAPSASPPSAAPRALSPAPAPAAAAPLPPSLVPGSPPPADLIPQRQSLIALPGQVNPANVPLPPVTPTFSDPGHSQAQAGGLAAIAEDERAASPSPMSMGHTMSPSPAQINTSIAPQLAPLALGGGNDSPLSAHFPPSAAGNPPTSQPQSQAQDNLVPSSSVKQKKRHSSLIASRDADLFVALGEVLGETGKEGEKKEAAEQRQQ